MWKFLVGVLVGLVVAFIAAVVFVFAIGRLFENRTPSVASNSALVLELSGDVPEEAPVDIPIPFLQSQAPPTVRDVWTSLRQAAADNRIKALVVEPQGLDIGWGKLEEIRREILDFKKSGKPVYAFLHSPGSREYYLATAADKIFISPDDSLEVKGFLLEQLYFKGTLDKLGVQVQVGHIGRYKDAGDIFTKTGMSPETREVLNQVLDQIYGSFCSGVAQARHKTADQVKTLIDNGPFLASQAKTSGLIDELGYEDEVYSDLKRKTGANNLKKINLRTYSRAAPGQGDRIALLVGEGDIISGNPGNGFGSQSVISSGGFSRLIRQVRNDSGIKGVILRVDSPGGDAVASDQILHELKLLSRAKPLVVSMSDVAASGGYYMSMTGDPVVAYPNTITGSIGVLYIRPNIAGLYDKLGIHADTLSRGKMADIDSASIPLSDAAKQKLHDAIGATYKTFVTKVASARKKTYAQIDPLAQGRVWMGAQAQDNGLIDDLGGLDTAVTLIRKKAGLSEKGATNLVLYPPRRSLLQVLTESSPEALESAAAQEKIRQVLPRLPGPAVMKGGVLSLLPYQITVH